MWLVPIIATDGAAIVLHLTQTPDFPMIHLMFDASYI